MQCWVAPISILGYCRCDLKREDWNFSGAKLCAQEPVTQDCTGLVSRLIFADLWEKKTLKMRISALKDKRKKWLFLHYVTDIA